MFWMISLKCVDSWPLNSVSSNPRGNRARAAPIAFPLDGGQGYGWIWGFSLLFLSWEKFSTLVFFSRSLPRLDFFRKIGSIKSREISEIHRTL